MLPTFPPLPLPPHENNGSPKVTLVFFTFLLKPEGNGPPESNGPTRKWQPFEEVTKRESL